MWFSSWCKYEAAGATLALFAPWPHLQANKQWEALPGPGTQLDAAPSPGPGGARKVAKSKSFWERAEASASARSAQQAEDEDALRAQQQEESRALQTGAAHPGLPLRRTMSTYTV